MTLSYDLYWSFRSPYSYMVMGRLAVTRNALPRARRVMPRLQQRTCRGGRREIALISAGKCAIAGDPSVAATLGAGAPVVGGD